MRWLIISEGFLSLEAVVEFLKEGDEVFLLPKGFRPSRPSLPAGLKLLKGAWNRKKTYEAIPLRPGDGLLLDVGRRTEAERVLKLLLELEQDLLVLCLFREGLEDISLSFPSVRMLRCDSLISEECRRASEEHRAKLRVRELRQVLDPGEHILILTQPDPDPDAIASGLALRAVLGRHKATAPIATFAAVTRPENLSMMKHLEIEVETVEEKDFANYERIALVDVQPTFLKPELSRVDAVIDHHPEDKGYEASFRDIRPSYGATATILTEYLRATGESISQRLATALFYGIKSDTLLFDRPACQADIEAFAFLYPKANHSLLHRIDRPEFPLQAIEPFIRALRKRLFREGLFYIHLGGVEREDVIPQLADFCLQMGGAEWSAVSGRHGRDLIISVRSAGFGKSIGEVVKEAFTGLGSAGGHRSMARANIPLRNFMARFKSSSDASIMKEVPALLLQELKRER